MSPRSNRARSLPDIRHRAEGDDITPTAPSAETRAKVLLDKLGIDEVVAAGGSGGARDMIIFTIMYPKKVRTLLTWCIVGGTYSRPGLAGVYNMGEVRAVRAEGIDGVLQMPAWKE